MLIANSSISTLSWFAHLLHINEQNNTRRAVGYQYEVVITGLSSDIFGHDDCALQLINFCLGNKNLLDLGNLLLLQDNSDSGTLVSGNELLCFNAPVGWSSRNQSLLEYNLASVCVYAHGYWILFWSICLFLVSISEILLVRSGYTVHVAM